MLFSAFVCMIGHMLYMDNSFLRNDNKNPLEICISIAREQNSDRWTLIELVYLLCIFPQNWH